jgi:hypothetical protein
MKPGFVAAADDSLTATTSTFTSGSSRRAGWIAAAGYLIVAVLATWPLVLGLGRDVPRDLGDSVFTMWVLAWDSDHFVKLLHGHTSALTGFFDANIFYPARLTLAYSEHFIPQAVQSFPIYLATHNPILCYNLLFLSSFVLAGVGTFLWTHELTAAFAKAPADTRGMLAAFIGGLLFAFAPYRIAQTSHLHVLSAQWMPFTLWGFSRYVASGRVRSLIGAAAALLVQSLSCGYYLLYFTPFAVAYVAWELWRHGRLHDRRMWLQLSLAAVGVGLLIAPLLLPYAAVRAQTQGTRAASEVVRYSADVYSYATAFSEQPFWGRRLRAFPKPEGELFPGFITIVLALIGVAAWSGGAEVYGPRPGSREKTSRKVLAAFCGVLSALYGVAFFAALLYRRVALDFWLFRLRMADATRPLAIAVGLLVLMCVLSPTARARMRAFLATRGFFVLALVAACWLSLGPVPQALGRGLDLASPYKFLYNYVPGWDAVRAPARFATIGVLMLSVLGAFGAAWLHRYRAGRAIVWVAGCLFLVESLAIPMTVNGVEPPEGFAAPSARIFRPARAPAVYHEIARQQPDAVVAELPLGQPDYDLRAVYYSVVHWRPVLNGYSGFFPPHYGQLVTALSDVPRHPDVAITALRAAGTTLVVVHEGAFVGDEGRNTSAALRTRGSVELFRDDGDVLFDVRRAR